MWQSRGGHSFGHCHAGNSLLMFISTKKTKKSDLELSFFVSKVIDFITHGFPSPEILKKMFLHFGFSK